MSLLKKAGSTVVKYFEWDLPKVLSYEGANLLKYTDNRRFSLEPDEVESNRDTNSKTLNGISPELLKNADNRRFSSEPDAVKFNRINTVMGYKSNGRGRGGHSTWLSPPLFIVS